MSQLVCQERSILRRYTLSENVRECKRECFQHHVSDSDALIETLRAMESIAIGIKKKLKKQEQFLKISNLNLINGLIMRLILKKLIIYLQQCFRPISWLRSSWYTVFCALFVYCQVTAMVSLVCSLSFAFQNTETVISFLSRLYRLAFIFDPIKPLTLLAVRRGPRRRISIVYSRTFSPPANHRSGKGTAPAVHLESDSDEVGK